MLSTQVTGASAPSTTPHRRPCGFVAPLVLHEHGWAVEVVRAVLRCDVRQRPKAVPERGRPTTSSLGTGADVLLQPLIECDGGHKT